MTAAPAQPAAPTQPAPVTGRPHADDHGEPPELQATPWLTASVGVAYIGAAVWVLVAGWILIVQPGNGPQAIALYAALVVLTALPGGLSLFNSGLLVQEVGRAANVVVQARRAARDSARTKAEFLATMSHEIRTPLNGIIGFTELLSNSRLNPRQREFTEAIRESSVHLLTIINDVLDYSKIDAGRVELDEKPIDVAALVESCRKSVSVAAAKRGLTLEFRLGPGTPGALFGDATRIRQVLLNLLSNAVKFTEQGGVRVTTHAHREADGRYAVSFVVQDTGIGMTMQDQNRLFRAFTQVDPSSTRSHGGTGLGLAISQRLCRLMGGDLSVQSAPGRGSTFTATIRVPAAPEPLPTLAPQGLAGQRVMIIDDDPVTRSTVARNAQAWGMLPRSTSDLARAMAWIHAGDPFDVAVVAHRRGGVNAVRVAEGLRAAGRASVPIVVLAPEMPDAGPRAKPFAARVSTPVEPIALLEGIQAALGHARGAPSPEEEVAADATRSDLRILLVEDNKMNRTLTLRVLEGLGYRADVAVNGLEAVRAVGSHRYDVILMDVQMPVMDGLEATRAIYRKVLSRARPVIIGLSANALPGDREQCLRAGMDEYAPKPMDQARLASLLAGVERRRRAAPLNGPLLAAS
jgi:signal transduction histidine kinase/CheY-like chemotaxis protein